jgi:hypothetical protein
MSIDDNNHKFYNIYNYKIMKNKYVDTIKII